MHFWGFLWMQSLWKLFFYGFSYFFIRECVFAHTLHTALFTISSINYPVWKLGESTFYGVELFSLYVHLDKQSLNLCRIPIEAENMGFHRWRWQHCFDQTSNGVEITAFDHSNFIGNKYQAALFGRWIVIRSQWKAFHDIDVQNFSIMLEWR